MLLSSTNSNVKQSRRTRMKQNNFSMNAHDIMGKEFRITTFNYFIICQMIYFENKSTRKKI